MAEFKDVMKQWRRFCKSHSHCGECEFDGKGICSQAHLSDVPYSDIELRIMAWAAEHPEPKYPTWYEVMAKLGVINGRLGDRTLGEHVIDGLIHHRIPADIAQKLGIEPKEE